MSKLFRTAIKRLETVRNDLNMSFDHSHTIIINEENMEKKRKAIANIEKAINQLEEIE